MIRKQYIILFAASLMLNTLAAQTVSINDLSPKELGIEGFSLKNGGEVTISGHVAAFPQKWGRITYFGWILDSNTRKVVWHTADEFDRLDRMDEGIYDFETQVNLKAGNYELMYGGMRRNYDDDYWAVNNINDVIDHIFHRDDHDIRRISEDLGIEVSARGLEAMDPVELLEQKTADAPFSITRIRDDETISKKFSLTGSTTFDVYAIGEGSKQEMYDYALIYDARTHKNVWVMDYHNTTHAGGAKKNYLCKDEVTLPEGSYILTYMADDSHAFNKWNSIPPEDPQFWGVTMWLKNPSEKRNIIPFQKDKLTEPVVDLTRIRNNEFVSQGFELKKDAKVSVQCFGESGGDYFADKGWIIDLSTGKTVWQIDRYNSDHAGGASKNRMAFESLNLDRGKYVAYFSTDDSHAFGRWNSTAPLESDKWGISIYAQDPSIDFELFNEKDYLAESGIVQIIRVRDNEYTRKSFHLDKETTITIKAIGEGTHGEMHDFGWIKNSDTRDIVWEMDYRDTEHAGGARKNRMVVQKITLPRGDYELYYETDGSHSYNDWNDSPPMNSEYYGIMLSIAE